MRFKKLTALFLSAVILASVSAQAAYFSDIQGHWAEDIIVELADRKIVNGVSDNVFNPEGTVTRAQFLKMTMEVMGIRTVPMRYGECLEARSSDWFAPYLQSALDKGLIPENMIAGYDLKVTKNADGTLKTTYSGAFNGDIAITREEMAVIAQYMYQYTLNASTMNNLAELKNMTFSDADSISGWAYKTVQLAYSQGFIDGMDDGTFAPGATATRAQAATIIGRMISE